MHEMPKMAESLEREMSPITVVREKEGDQSLRLSDLPRG